MEVLLKLNKERKMWRILIDYAMKGHRIKKFLRMFIVSQFFLRGYQVAVDNDVPPPPKRCKMLSETSVCRTHHLLLPLSRIPEEVFYFVTNRGIIPTWSTQALLYLSTDYSHLRRLKEHRHLLHDLTVSN